jgi:hypothetical protein
MNAKLLQTQTSLSEALHCTVELSVDKIQAINNKDIAQL